MPRRQSAKVLTVVAVLVALALSIWAFSAYRASRELLAARKRLEEVLNTPVYEGYRRAAERQAQLKLPDAELEIPLYLPLRSAPDLPLEDASEVVLSWSLAEEDWTTYDGALPASPVVEWTDADRARVDAHMARRAAIVDALRDLIHRGGPVARPEWGYDSTKAWWYCRGVRHAARPMMVEALRQSARGNDQAAMDVLIDIMTLADRVGDEPVMPMCTVSNALYAMSLGTLEQMTWQRDVAPALITGICDRLASAHGRKAFPQRLSCALFGSLNEFTYYDGEFPPKFPFSTRQWLTLCSYRVPVGNAWRYHDEAALLMWGMHFMDLAELPYYEAAAADNRDSLPELGVVANMCAHGMIASLKSQAHHETRIDLTRLGLLIELYQREHGVLPETLDALKPALGGPVPIDPFSGEPYRYVRRDGGFLLYGFGQNKTDENGYHDYEVGDIVWRGQVDPALVARRHAETDRILKEEFGIDPDGEEGE